MSEEHLRALLRRAVPDAPAIDTTGIGTRAARERRRRLATVGGVAAVLVVTAGGLAISGLPRDSDRRDVVTTPRPTPSDELAPTPYDVKRCPAWLPDPDNANRVVTGLDDVVAVRMCPDFDPRRHPGWSPSPENLAELDDADALVHDVNSFTARVRDLPLGLPDYCRDGGIYIDEGFAFHRADGTEVLLSAAGCQLVTIEGRNVDGGALRELYLTALNRQRSKLEYSRPFDDELRCTAAERGGPVRPGREELVAAVLCDLPPGAESIAPGLKPMRLDADQLAALNRAWNQPGKAVIREGDGPHECLDGLAEPPSFILAATDRSDVVQLIDSPCGFLVWHGTLLLPAGDGGATIPITLEQLGLEQ